MSEEYPPFFEEPEAEGDVEPQQEVKKPKKPKKKQKVEPEKEEADPWKLGNMIDRVEVLPFQKLRLDTKFEYGQVLCCICFAPCLAVFGIPCCGCVICCII